MSIHPRAGVGIVVTEAKKTNIKSMTNKETLDQFYWYENPNDEIISSQLPAQFPPDYPSVFQQHFGYDPCVTISIREKILYLSKISGLRKLMHKFGFILLEQYRYTLKFIHYSQKIIVSCSASDDVTAVDDIDDDEEDENVGEDFFITAFPSIENKKILTKILKQLDKFFVDASNISDKFYMIAENRGGLYTERTRFKPIPVKDDRFDLFYGKEFPHEKMQQFVTGTTENLLLLHGDPGTGKSNYIKHLIKNSEKKVIYIPPSMLSVISSPGFVSFMMANKNSILLIEDAEEVLSVDRNSATNNLLGVTDGFLKDALGLKVIATFNCPIGKIDPALMRKGRLYLEYKFDQLSVDECKTLANFVGLDREINEPMTLAELFNKESNTSDNSLEERSIGFF